MEEIVIDTSLDEFSLNKEFKCSGFGLRDLLTSNEKIVGLEIGCDVGDTAEFLLRSLPNLTLYSVDPYTDYVDWNGNSLTSREQIYNNVLKRLENYSDRFNLIRKTSDEAFSEFDDDYFDFVFIDGLHTYEQLTKDCDNFYSKVRSGGIFSGHDYETIKGVNKAAKEFAAKCKKDILTTECDVWYWYK